MMVTNYLYQILHLLRGESKVCFSVLKHSKGFTKDMAMPEGSHGLSPVFRVGQDQGHVISWHSRRVTVEKKGQCDSQASVPGSSQTSWSLWAVILFCQGKENYSSGIQSFFWLYCVVLSGNWPSSWRRFFPLTSIFFWTDLLPSNSSYGKSKWPQEECSQMQRGLPSLLTIMSFWNWPQGGSFWGESYFCHSNHI